MLKRTIAAVAVASAFTIPAAHAGVSLIAWGSLTGATDFAALSNPAAAGLLENGVDLGNVLGGIGSGLAWAGGSTFLALPDRGPNATAWNSGVDNTTSYISRFETVKLSLTKAPSGGLPYTLTPTLQGTTLLSSAAPLNYGSVVPAGNSSGKYYFSGRSDNFLGTGSTNPANGRLDPEGIRVSADGRSVFVSDEYGPYVYQFDRATGQRLRSYDLPAVFTAKNLNSVGNTEITGNASGRVANKGMEGLAITPNGKTLVGFEQSPLIQDGGDGGRLNRIVTIDVKSGATHQFAYDNKIGTKNYNSSEILALNDHEFLVLERDGKGLGDGSSAAVKQIYKIDISGATDIGALTDKDGNPLAGETNLLPYAVKKTLFLDIRAELGLKGIGDKQVPAKLEGMAFGDDIVMDDGKSYHTLYVANDNDFLPDVAGQNKFFVFAFSDADLAGSVFTNQTIAAVPEPETYAMMLAGLGLLGAYARRRRS